MCRIFGYFGQNEICEIALRETAEVMKHGGPDKQSYHNENNWALGNDRLSIQGVEGGNQPFMEQKDVCVVFNGEIYNHRDLRNELRQKGFSFNDDCDGNVIAPLFMLYGPDFVSRLDGMFAIALVDNRDRPTLHIFSDPAAIKSVYYHWNEREKTFYFASEVEGLVRLTQKLLEIDERVIFDYLSLRAVCGEPTIFRNVRTLGPSRHLSCVLGQEPKVSFYQTAITASAPNPDLALSGQHFQQMLDREVEQMLRADVPVCVVTSGGLDSTIISALAAKHVRDLHSFHICYKGDWPHDERNYAREAAQRFGTTHHEIEIDPATFPDHVLRMIAHIGQPNTAPHSLSAYCLFAGIHEAGFRVALTGEGSDELFAGYERFGAALSPQDDWIPGYLDKFGPFPANLRDDVLTKEFVAMAQQTTSRVEEFTKKILQTTPGVERLNALQALDQWERFPFYILRRVDHLSMAHAVEVRVPFCQPRIVDYARQLPVEHRLSEGKSKRIVYEASRGLIPDSILTRKKQPFTLPITAMIRPGAKLFDFMQSVFNDTKFRQRGYFQTDKLQAYIQQQAATPCDGVANMLWSVMSLELWQQHIDKLNHDVLLHHRQSCLKTHKPGGKMPVA